MAAGFHERHRDVSQVKASLRHGSMAFSVILRCFVTLDEECVVATFPGMCGIAQRVSSRCFPESNKLLSFEKIPK